MNKTNFTQIYIFRYKQADNNSQKLTCKTPQQPQIKLPPINPSKIISSDEKSINDRIVHMRHTKPQAMLLKYINKTLNISENDIIKLIQDKHNINMQCFNGFQLLQDHFGNRIPNCYKTTHKKLAENNYISYLEFLNLSEMIGEYKTNIALRKRHKTE